MDTRQWGGGVGALDSGMGMYISIPPSQSPPSPPPPSPNHHVTPPTRVPRLQTFASPHDIFSPVRLRSITGGGNTVGRGEDWERGLSGGRNVVRRGEKGEHGNCHIPTSMSSSDMRVSQNFFRLQSLLDWTTLILSGNKNKQA